MLDKGRKCKHRFPLNRDTPIIDDEVKRIKSSLLRTAAVKGVRQGKKSHNKTMANVLHCGKNTLDLTM